MKPARPAIAAMPSTSKLIAGAAPDVCLAGVDDAVSDAVVIVPFEYPDAIDADATAVAMLDEAVLRVAVTVCTTRWTVRVYVIVACDVWSSATVPVMSVAAATSAAVMWKRIVSLDVRCVAGMRSRDDGDRNVGFSLFVDSDRDATKSATVSRSSVC